MTWESNWKVSGLKASHYCETELYGNPPEWGNSISALFIVFIGYIGLFKGLETNTAIRFICLVARPILLNSVFVFFPQRCMFFHKRNYKLPKSFYFTYRLGISRRVFDDICRKHSELVTRRPPCLSLLHRQSKCNQFLSL